MKEQEKQAIPRDAAIASPAALQQRQDNEIARSTRRAEPCIGCGGRLPAGVTPLSAVPGESVTEAVSTAGQPLDAATRASMEGRFGHDFSRVRVHADRRAAQAAATVQAAAFTVGNDVVLGAGRSASYTSDGRLTLAHELAHVVQQNAGGAAPRGTVSVEADGSAEREAEAATASVSAGRSAFVSRGRSGRGAVLQRQPAPTAQLNLMIDERGLVDATLSGPGLPLVANPTLGIRRNADGTLDILFGARSKTVAASEVPGLFRSALGEGGQPPAGIKGGPFHAPTCDQLSAVDGTRLMTFAEYQVSRMLSPTMLPLSPALYEALTANCRVKAPQPMERPQPEINDLPGSTLPAGTAMA